MEDLCGIHGLPCHYYHCKTSHVIPGSLDSWLDGESPETKEIWTTKVKINGEGIDIPKDVRLTDSMVRHWWNYKVPSTRSGMTLLAIAFNRGQAVKMMAPIFYDNDGVEMTKFDVVREIDPENPEYKRGKVICLSYS